MGAAVSFCSLRCTLILMTQPIGDQFSHQIAASGLMLLFTYSYRITGFVICLLQVAGHLAREGQCYNVKFMGATVSFCSNSPLIVLQ